MTIITDPAPRAGDGGADCWRMMMPFDFTGDLPRSGQRVVAYLYMPTCYPGEIACVAWRMSDDWWAGLAGHYQRIDFDYDLVRWEPLPSPETRTVERATPK